VVLVKDSAPAVKLDDKYYKLVDKLEALTLRAPSLIDATSLTVKGPLKFVPGIKIVGDVTFVNGTIITVDQCVRECIRVTTIVTCLDDVSGCCAPLQCCAWTAKVALTHFDHFLF